MNPYFNDSDLDAKHERYRDMLRQAEANIELRRGELRPSRPGLGSIAAALASRIVTAIRHRVTSAGEAIKPSADPCADPQPCD